MATVRTRARARKRCIHPPNGRDARKRGEWNTACRDTAHARRTSSTPNLALGLEVAEGEFEATVFGVVVVADGEGDVEGIAGEEFGVLQALGHVPAEGVEGDVALPVLRSRFSALGRQFSALSSLFAVGGGGSEIAPADLGAVG